MEGDPITLLQNGMRAIIQFPYNMALARSIGRVHVLPDSAIPGQGFMGAAIDRHLVGRVEQDIRVSEIVLKCK